METAAEGQGVGPDDGHATLNGNAIVGSWNVEAGDRMPRRFTQYPELSHVAASGVVPNLNGWDFRINLPHTRFELAQSEPGGEPAMVGVVEDPSPIQNVDATLTDYGHRNNAIWMFRVFDRTAQAYFKVLPSRRDRQSSATENVRSLTEGWTGIGSRGNPRLKREKIGAAVLGRGLGQANIVLVARREDDELVFSRHAVASTDDSTWSGQWSSVYAASATPPAVEAAFDGKLALGYVDRDSGKLRVKIYDPADDTWSAAAEVNAQPVSAPQLVWDGAALNLLFVREDGRLRHAYALEGAGLSFRDEVTVFSLLVVREGRFDAMVFNGRLHVTLLQEAGTTEPTQVWYTTTKTPGGEVSSWAVPSVTGLLSRDTPRIANVYENIFVVAVGPDGAVTYARKDPNRPGNDLTGNVFADRWLEQPAPLDDQERGTFSGLDLLSFNSDLYLAAERGLATGSARQTYVINLGRSAMKQLILSKWGMEQMWGGVAPPAVKGVGGFAQEEEIPALGDFDGNGLDDLVNFTQRQQAGVGPAPVVVSLNVNGSYSSNEVWHTFFSLNGEIPAVGDFNGDGKDDIVTFTQEEQLDAGGNVIGPAVVWVALSDGARFQTSRVWHTFFSLKGEIPAVGDFNGDGRDDIVTFTQEEQLDAGGNVIGPAVVWVALSDGARFQTSRVWHTFFSLKGEIPAVGDFNGDGRDDIVTFTQEEQLDAGGNVIGAAVVWVALSDGTKFDRSTVWQTSFSHPGELPIVGDLDFDGSDDVASVVRGSHSDRRRNDVYVALSVGTRFDRPVLWHSSLCNEREIPAIGNFMANTLADITGRPSDADRIIPSVFTFRDDGAVKVAGLMGNTPFPPGAPWENYKWFTEKGLGVAQFPEWIFEEGPDHCIGAAHQFVLAGASGSGGPTRTTSSVRSGGRAAHILQELGHSFFANCFDYDYDNACQVQAGHDPFAGIANRPSTAEIFETPISRGGFAANSLDGCSEPVGCPAPDDSSDPEGFLDCRDPEHYFLGLMVKYRLSGDEYRSKLESETDEQLRNQLTARYHWLKERWFEGVEFKRGPAINASLTQDGVQCLSGECPTPEQAASLEVQLMVVPDDDPGRFHLRIDGVVRASNVGNDGTTGGRTLKAGSHTVSQSAAPGTTLTNYRTFIGGACSLDGRVVLSSSDDKTCTIVNVAVEGGTQQCVRDCRKERDECMQDPQTLPQICVAMLNVCLASCN